MAERPREQQPLLSELSTASAAYQTARHEVGHGLLGEVIAISVIPHGNTLGWTLLRNVDNLALAAGIYDGHGFGSDKARIEINARENGLSPDLAVNLAVTEASRILGPKERLIDLMARELAIRGSMSGSEFDDLRRRAQREIDNTLETPFDWPWSSDEESDTKQEAIDLTDNDPHKIIPKEGEFTLVVNTEENQSIETYIDGQRTKRITYNEDGYTVEKFENGASVESEIWIQVNKDRKDEDPKYEKRNTFYPSIIAQKGTLFTYNSLKGEISLN